jgi:hypothetical protein
MHIIETRVTPCQLPFRDEGMQRDSSLGLRLGVQIHCSATPRPNKSNITLRLDKCHFQGLAVFGRRPSSVVAAVALARKRPGEALRN